MLRSFLYRQKITTNQSYREIFIYKFKKKWYGDQIFEMEREERNGFPVVNMNYRALFFVKNVKMFFEGFIGTTESVGQLFGVV